MCGVAACCTVQQSEGIEERALSVRLVPPATPPPAGRFVVHPGGGGQGARVRMDKHWCGRRNPGSAFHNIMAGSWRAPQIYIISNPYV